MCKIFWWVKVKLYKNLLLQQVYSKRILEQVVVKEQRLICWVLILGYHRPLLMTCDVLAVFLDLVIVLSIPVDSDTNLLQLTTLHSSKKTFDL